MAAGCLVGVLTACGGGGQGESRSAPVLAVPSIPSLATDMLVFNSNRTGHHEIFAMHADGSGVTQLTRDAAWDNWSARISPDRRQVLFYRQAVGQPLQSYEQASLWVMNADGSGLRELRAPGQDGWGLQGHAEWSPDGTHLAMSGGTKADKQVYLTDAQGQSPQQLTHRAGLAFDPSWSPDGRSIVFSGCPDAPCGDADSTRFELYLTEARPDQPVTRLTDDALADLDPSFSPDGRAIAWLSTDPAGQPGPSSRLGVAWSIRLMDLATHSVQWVVHDDDINSRPVWRRDGQAIYFHRLLSDRSRHWGIYQVRPDGSGLTALVDGTAHDDEFPSD